MSNFENIKQMSKEDLAAFLCNLMCADCCETRCPARAECSYGHSGMLDFLDKEASDEYFDRV